MHLQERARRLLPGLWGGFLLCVALVAAPAPFAVLASADAGRVVGRILEHEAYASVGLGITVLLLERLHAHRQAHDGRGSQFSTGMMMALGAIFSTVVGYFGLQSMMLGARTGEGPLSFGQLHALSVAFFAIRICLVLALAWRAAAAALPGFSPTASS